MNLAELVQLTVLFFKFLGSGRKLRLKFLDCRFVTYLGGVVSLLQGGEFLLQSFEGSKELRKSLALFGRFNEELLHQKLGPRSSIILKTERPST